MRERFDQHGSWSERWGLRFADLRPIAGPRLDELPFCLRILLENALRHGDEDDAAALVDWARTTSSTAEIKFRPQRVLMHDTTAVPALVDIAAMRDVLAENGCDPRRLTPVCPVDVAIDHSVAIDRYGSPDAMAWNMRLEAQRNHERYAFLKWAGQTLDGFRVFPPGTGILHTINLEFLASVVTALTIGDNRWAVPDTLIGTDSHTPMINALGVLAWGVGGLEAESAIFGVPISIAVPNVVGVCFTGALPPVVTATDLALAVTEKLRTFGVVGHFVEFFGPGVASLDVGTRAAIANMAPEYGATIGYFPIDRRTIDYLRRTGRNEEHAAFVEDYAVRQSLWNPGDATPRYSSVVQIDLSSISSVVAGPTRPQDRIPLDEVPSRLDLKRNRPEQEEMPAAPVALAAITSCTNTADPRLLIAAGLLARNARQRDLHPPKWVKTSFAPGSGVALRYLGRAGLLDDLAAIGFDVTGIGCTACIGNSGPLAPSMEDALDCFELTPIAVISGNRNFPGRIHAQIDKALLASPPLVVAYALAGSADVAITHAPLGFDATGKPSYLRDLWPTTEEIDTTLLSAMSDRDVEATYDDLSGSDAWRSVEAPSGDLFPWDDHSTYLRRPPFVRLVAEQIADLRDMAPLAVFGDDVTTDHISPAGAIPSGSAAADYLVSNGADPEDLNVYASRRGNFEVMGRGAFTNRMLVNRLALDAPAGMTRISQDDDPLTLRDAANHYGVAGCVSFLIAGERYGAGSSRDWAAKATALLGVRAVLASSFERIHRSNLVNLGIAPIALPAPWRPDRLEWRADDRLTITLPDVQTPRCTVVLTLRRADGSTLSEQAELQCETRQEIEVLGAGGLMPLILRAAIQHDDPQFKEEN